MDKKSKHRKKFYFCAAEAALFAIGIASFILMQPVGAVYVLLGVLLLSLSISIVYVFRESSAAEIREHLNCPDGIIRQDDFEKNDTAPDHLTGLTNRQDFFNSMVSLEQSAFVDGISLILCDIDNLKSINDTHTHAIGDKAIQAVGQLFRGQASGLMGVARIGGDEFALLAAADNNQAWAMAEFLKDEIAHLPGEWKELTASFGIDNKNRHLS